MPIAMTDQYHQKLVCSELFVALAQASHAYCCCRFSRQAFPS